MKPGTWVPIAWLLIILTFVFLLLVLPGLTRNGTYLTVETLPPDAEVIFDGVRLGPSGQPLFAHRNTAELVIRKFGYADFSEVTEIKGRVFASRIFPRKETIHVSLEPLPDYSASFHGIGSYIAWAGTGPESERYAIPSSLTLAAREMVAIDPNSSGTISGTIPVETVLPYAVDERHLSDVFRSRAVLASDGGAPGLSSLASLAGEALDVFGNDPVMISGVASLTSEEDLGKRGLSDTTALIRQEQDSAAESLESHYSTTFRPSSRYYGDYRFVAFPDQMAPAGDIETVQAGYNPRSGATPSSIEIGSFLLADREVSNSEYEIFVGSNPRWSVDNVEALIEDGLADESYLSEWTTSGPAPGSDDLPVTGVSWYAAVAYADWFTDANLAGTGYMAGLPGEYQWEAAARWNRVPDDTRDLPDQLQNTDTADGGIIGIMGMAGNIREWCATAYAYNAPIFGTPDIDSSEIDAPRAVRGGAYIDANLPYPASARGSLQPSVCSPVVGFRLALFSDEG